MDGVWKCALIFVIYIRFVAVIQVLVIFVCHPSLICLLCWSLQLSSCLWLGSLNGLLNFLYPLLTSPLFTLPLLTSPLLASRLTSIIAFHQFWFDKSLGRTGSDLHFHTWELACVIIYNWSIIILLLCFLTFSFCSCKLILNLSMYLWIRCDGMVLGPYLWIISLLVLLFALI